MPAEPAQPGRRRRGRTLGWILLALCALLLGGYALAFDRLHIAGPDMAPTLAMGEYYLVSRLHREPARGELVVFDVPGGEGRSSVRRVVGLPGDKIEYRGQNVLVNGEPAVLEPDGTFQVDVGPLARTLERFREHLPACPSSHFVSRDPQRRSKDQPVATVPAASYYLLADNRNHGRDSREYGPVPGASVRGTVIRRIASLWRYEKIE